MNYKTAQRTLSLFFCLLIATPSYSNLCTAYRYKDEKTEKKSYKATNVWVGGEFDESYRVEQSAMPKIDFGALKSRYKEQNNSEKEEKKSKESNLDEILKDVRDYLNQHKEKDTNKKSDDVFDEDLANTWNGIFDDIKNKKN